MKFHFGKIGAGKAYCGKRPHALHGLLIAQSAAEVTCVRCLKKKAARDAKLIADAALAVDVIGDDVLEASVMHTLGIVLPETHRG